MKFFICTLYSGEPDLPDCLRAIATQGVEFEHKIISFKREIVAHDELYQAFNSVDKSWICAKIDADVVLYDGALLDISEIFNRNYDFVDPCTHDFYTDSDIHAGVAFFRGLKFRKQENPLWTDRGIYNSRNAKRSGRSIGDHAYRSNELTSFHYGFHRGLKSQLTTYDLVKKAYEKYGDNKRLMALRGFELGQSDEFIDWHTGKDPIPTCHDYHDTRFQEYYEKYSDVTVQIPDRTWR